MADRSPKKFALRAALVLFGTVAVLFALLLSAYVLPGTPVRAHLVPSAALIEKEGLYPEYFGFKLFQMDNYTDTLMLFEAASADETDPLTAVMTNTAYNPDNFETLGADLAEYLDRRAIAEGAEGHPDESITLKPFSYARYWHGYLIWLRPLLLVFTYGQIRAVNYLVLALLFAAVCRLLYRRCGVRAAVWFTVSQLLVSVWFVPRQLQFFTTFVIAYAGCVWVLYRHRTVWTLCLGMVALGAATAFCDLLVTPLLTLGLPLTCWLLRPMQRLRAGAPQCAAVAAAGLCWGGGYAVCWALKWPLASLVTGQDIVGDAVRQIAVRTADNTWHGMELTWRNIIQFVYSALVERGLLWPLAAGFMLAIAVFVLCLRSRAALGQVLPLGLVALLVPLWFVVLRTHSIQHGWFVWRVLAVTLFAGAAFVHTACSPAAGRTRLAKIFGKK